MNIEHDALDPPGLTAAGLSAHEVEQWRSARPTFTAPGKASEASLPADAEALRIYVERGHGLAARLPTWAARTPVERAAARHLYEALRRARRLFLRSYAEPVYAQLTDDYQRFLRADGLAELAARRYPGLVPTPEALRTERQLAQKDKDAGAELDLGIFFEKILEQARAGSHLMHAMQRPKPESEERLAAFRARGEVDLGVVHVARRGRGGVVELRNLRYLNAEDNAAAAALETVVDLVLLHPELEAGVLRGGVVDHPKHSGRRIFQSGANLTHLYDGQMGLVDFFLTRELGYINKMYRGLAGSEWVPGEAEATHEKPWIAAVESFAIGGGCQITLVCDRVLCEEGAYFSLPARQEGFVPGCANLRLARLGGERLARQAILFGRVLTAGTPEAAALCDEVIPRGQMDAAIDRAVVDITEGGAISVAAQRKAMRVGVETPDTFRQYMALYIREQATCLYSEGLVANLERYWTARALTPSAR
jgi:(3,5-dihydroxyphenyl)acetyl-CoA 1,2-dioxygenase